MIRQKFINIFFVLATSAGLIVGAGEAIPATETEIHDLARQSIVRLTATGLASVGDQINDPVTAVGTGFFIGDGGYILTTAHFFDPLKKVFAVDTKITAEVFGLQREVDVLYISELSSLDLVLLRAFKPDGVTLPPSLKIGSSSDINPGVTGLLTSGWDDMNLLRDRLEFNSTTTELVPYAWSLRGNVQGGQSGSPVYVDRDGMPLVVGVLKATARNNRTLALMIPIENSFQLIGQFRMQELQREVELLRNTIGRMEAPPDRPLTTRVEDIEKSVQEIEASFSWSAETDDSNGSVIIMYEKLVSDGPQIDEISVKIQPFLYVADETDRQSRRGVTSVPTWAPITQRRSALEDGNRVGKFVLLGIRRRLTDVILNAGDSFRDQDPYRDVSLVLSATIGDVPFRKTLSWEPKYSWSFDQ